MKNNKHVDSFGQFNENLNISDVRSSKLNEDNRSKFESVVKLHQFLSKLIDNGKGEYIVQMDVEGYTYDFIDEIKIDDNSGKIYII